MFVKHYESNDFPDEEMDVDVLISDEEEVILMQLKRTKFRLNLKDAYFGNVNSDRKAGRQLNNGHGFLDNQENSLTKGKGFTNGLSQLLYENVLTEFDGCLKVNFRMF